MATIGGDLVTGVFESPAQAMAATQKLRELGFANDAIGWMGRHETEAQSPDAAPQHSRHDPLRGAEAGALTGLGMGGVIATALTTAAFPLVGPVVAAGVLAAIAEAAASGAIAGGLIGGLVGMGLSEHEASHVQKSLGDGHVLVTVKSASRQEQAKQVLDQMGAKDIGAATADAEGQQHPAHLRFRQAPETSTPGGFFTATGDLERELDPPSEP